MKKQSILSAMITFALVFGLTLVSCNNDSSSNSGGFVDKPGNGQTPIDSISLYKWSSYYIVEFTVSKVPSVSIRNDITFTIDGAVVNTTGSQWGYRYNNPIGQLFFNNPALTVGTSYAVSVNYNGSEIAPFTLLGTVVCQAQSSYN